MCLTAGFVIANFVRFGHGLAEPGIAFLAIFVPVFFALAFSQGAYSVEALRSPQTSAVRVVKTLAVTGCALLVGLFYAKTSGEVSRAVFGLGFACSAVLLMVVRHSLTAQLGRRFDWMYENEVLLVDHAPPASFDAPNVIYAHAHGLDPFQNDPEMADRVGGLLHGYDRVVLNSSPQRRLQWVKYLKGIGIDVEVLTPELEQLGALSMRRSPNGAAVLVAAGPMGLRDRFLKRALDLVLGFGLLLFFAPLMLAVALAIKLTSRGPVLFKQSRIGRSNRSFDLFKFRSMRTEVCDHHGVVSALRQDPRLTPVGAFLRRTSIDELPQLFNVIRGDMSIVGPRPHAPGSTAENDLFWDIDERYWHRGAVKPGITGLAQVRGFRGATSTRKELTDRVQADLEYLADWSLSKDLLIICRTARVIVHPNAF
jgi:exopolysaccharide biosynthesis polyprenyl glycosylphosphotransferase